VEITHPELIFLSQYIIALYIAKGKTLMDSNSALASGAGAKLLSIPIQNETDDADPGVKPNRELARIVAALINHSELGDKLNVSFRCTNPEFRRKIINSSCSASDRDYFLSISCVSLTYPTDLVKKFDKLFKLQISPFLNLITSTPSWRTTVKKYAVVPKVAVLTCLADLKAEEPSITLERLVVARPEEDGRARYNKSMVSFVDITDTAPRTTNDLTIVPHTYETFVEEHEDRTTKVCKITLTIVVGDILPNILVLSEFLAELASLKCLPRT